MSNVSSVTPVRYDALSQPERRAVRESYVQAQGGACHHCKAPLDGPPTAEMTAKRITPRLYPATFFRFPVHLHHSRKTGLTIGAVHNRCNAILWEYHGE